MILKYSSNTYSELMLYSMDHSINRDIEGEIIIIIIIIIIIMVMIGVLMIIVTIFIIIIITLKMIKK